MKSIIDLEAMKKQPTNVFGNAYAYLIESLANDYISKTTGRERIQNELSKWDADAQAIILEAVKKIVEETGLKFVW